MTAPRGTKRSAARASGGRAPIDHAKVIDGFGELTERTHYERREVRCGRCSRLFTFEPAAQKHVHRLVALARRAHRLDRGRLDALYWEGRALEAAGHSSRAARAYQTFLDVMRDRPGHRALVTDATSRLARAAHP